MKQELAKWGQWLRDFFIVFGAPGLIGLSFVDSGLMPLPEAIDALVVAMSARQPNMLLWYALAATIGSLAGCMFLYYIAARGGHAFLERRMGKERSDRLRARFDEYEFAIIFGASILPPPTPFKAFILTAGVVEVNPWKFALAIFLGRGLRYAVEGYLAIKYGDAVWEWMKHHGVQMFLGLLAAGLVIGLAMWLRQRGKPSEAA